MKGTYSSLPRAKQHNESTSNPLHLRMTLINTRLVTNNTFILSDLFSSRNLDFLFLTETWLCPGDLSPFSELLPSKCLFFNSPCTTGGLVSIYKDNFICRSGESNNYSSFELQFFVLELGDPLLIAVTYAIYYSGNSVGFESRMTCLADVKAWLSLHFLIFNEKKNEIIVFRLSEFLDSPNLDLGEMSLCLKSWVRNLGIIFDDVLKFDRQINSVVKGSFFQLCLLSKAKPFLSFKDFEKVGFYFHAFILSRLDYCNSLYFGIRQTATSRLKLGQNAAARLLSGVKKREHITPILRSLHWLPVCFRVDFKILLLVYKFRNGLAPTYLCELLTEYQPIRSLRSSNQDLLSTPKSRLN